MQSRKTEHDFGLPQQKASSAVGLSPGATFSFVYGQLKTIRDCNIRNYSIFLKDGYLFGHYEYVGEDHEADMAKMAADPETQQWWSLIEPMQEALENRNDGKWWSDAEEVFHTD